ncbi:hypothetical protein [Pseudolactococcus chungangensis]|jgi:hypothetical protein|uniref:hypothetical protein n=1 Tax=Pseudolactococcus chungangensis TaxID=451457 RepID=UPI0028D5F354|nr:hypothetical protein [Lactococcus chungangensis]
MKKRIKILLVILIPIVLITGGLLMKLGTPLDHFLTHDYTVVTKQDQIDYLKKHEQEMTDAMLDKKVKSVQWQWETLEVGTIGNGTPQGGGTMLTIHGKFNDIEDSDFVIGFELKNTKSYPNMGHMLLMQPLRVLKNGGWEIVYDEEGDRKNREREDLYNQQVEFLKSHEEEMTNYIKSQNPKIKSVQYHWDSLRFSGSSVQYGEPYAILFGNVDGNEETTFMLEFKSGENNFPHIETMFLNRKILIKKGDEWVNYE